jgi:hypothetical protein
VYIESTEHLDRLFQDFSDGTVVTVSDGSFFPDTRQAACAWVIESACRSQWIMGSIKTPGSQQAHSAYRSELAGLMAISTVLKLLSCCLPSPSHIIVGCDGQAALSTLSAHRDDLKAASKHSDIQSVIIDLWATMKTAPYPVHIKGHQDKSGHYLSRLEEMNILVDRLATLTASAEVHPQSQCPVLTHLGLVPVQYKGHFICGDMYNTLYTGLTRARLQDYISTKLLSPRAELANINFRAFTLARKQAPVATNKFISKWISDTLATGRVLQKRNHRIFNRCPRCDAWGEDKLHVAICWDLRARVIWDKQMTQLKALLISLHTHPDIYNFITHGLEYFRAHPTQGPQRQYQELWQIEQSSIGWLNFITGFLGNLMVHKQQEHYLALGIRKKGHTWAAAIVNHGWYTVQKLWRGRNMVLHNKDRIHSLSGGALLDIEIEKEYALGCAELPRPIRRWFNQSLEQLMGQTIEYKKGWLLIVRTVKEAMHIAEYSIFSSSKTLRQWVGLENMD